METSNSANSNQDKLKELAEQAAQQKESLQAQIKEHQAQTFSSYKEAPVALRRWTVEEYDAMLKNSILTERDRVELVNGQIIEMSPQNPPHAAATNRATNLCNTLFAGLALIRTQTPVVLNDNSQPEPDIAVVRRDDKEYSDSEALPPKADRHPTANETFLIIEISDETIYFDLNEKALAYAKSGIEDYWIIDVRRRQVHILRQPVDGVYMQKKTCKLITENSFETPLAFPNIKVLLLDLLPL